MKWVQANPGVNLDIIHIACWRQLVRLFALINDDADDDDDICNSLADINNSKL